MTFQYYPKESFMHKVDPVSKLIWLVCLSLSVFIFNTAIPEFILFLITFTMAVGLARLKIAFLLKGLWVILVFSLGFFILQVFMVPGQTLWMEWGSIRIYQESVNFAVAITLRMLTIFISSLIFVVTTDPRDIVLALSQKLKVPYRFAYAISIALRFIPTLEEEARVIETAQTIRGVRKQKGWKNKLENMKRFTLPLLMSSIRRVQVTSITMEAKGYGAYKDRTYIRHIRILKEGTILYVVSICTLCVLAILKIVG
ncbi:energy-coupling factor transporter transmembrane component T family protein [Terrilactibacillus laevilacticus]|uniref:energy-coupling factor transporter transmembrane component T family protein n=1 Tax=Terrilactibacillus laevilacticus TaxID=1380157 RepID=UPI001FEA3705|nr:energy-coupling factor transporter transmembrane component T [Terrilactibacillus laevilacticus]